MRRQALSPYERRMKYAVRIDESDDAPLVGTVLGIVEEDHPGIQSVSENADVEISSQREIVIPGVEDVCGDRQQDSDGHQRRRYQAHDL